MRYKYLIPLLLILAILTGILLNLNVIAKKGFIVAIQNLTHAKVDVKKTKVELSPLKVSFYGVKIAHPNKEFTNFLEFEEAILSVKFWALLHKKVVINDAKLIDLSLLTPRKESGFLPKTKIEPVKKTSLVKEKLSKSLNKQLASFMPSDINIDTLLGTDTDLFKDIYKETELELKTLDQKWRTVAKNNSFSQELSGIEKQIQTLDTSSVETVEDIQRLISKIQTIKESSKKLHQKIEGTKAAFDNDFKKVMTKQKEIKKIGEKELSKALSRIPSNPNSTKIGDLLFSQTIQSKIDPVISMVSKIKNVHTATKIQKPQQKGRLEGTTILFKDKKQYPKFWIKELTVSGKGRNNQYIKGSGKDLTTNQKLTNKTMSLSINTNDVFSKGTSSKITLKQKLILDDSKTYLYISAKKIPLKKLSIFESQSESVTLVKGNATIFVSLTLMQDFIDGKLRLNANKLSIQTKGMKKGGPFSLQTMAANTIEDIKSTSVKASIKGRGNEYSLKITTPFDKLFASKINSLMKKKINQQKEKVRKIVEKAVLKQETVLASMINKKKSSLGEGLLKQYEESGSLTTLLTKQDELAKSKLTKKTKEIQDKASKKVKDALRKELNKLPF
tara:strand:- start:7016 stop:8863 length:1848 start_codon:yes stop_codon:yes gene_type:complete